ncbi:hypothetical protein CAPTEDRAFT_122174 [Capitella teleta]|uniref:Clock n=1 Tax=Capitella teleta TaxID=283909 RepID=R7V588_CAPTE|nr:hypothetical protein CAPTEDRAFT_122174 [Capitella teleta]|eukprot:ELU13627.1 hypothetical protein CAPTEDRAFT_122174 [Capitella teleta]
MAQKPGRRRSKGQLRSKVFRYSFISFSFKSRKSRNLSEKKRRDQFNMLINELFSMVATSNRKMDKTTTLKTTIAFLRQHNEVTQQSHIHEVSEDWKPSFLSNDEFTQLMLESQESFVLVVSQDGTILYTSEGITSLLNQIPADIVSDSIYHHIHPDERLRVKGLLLGHNAALNSSPCDFNRSENQLSFTCHFKCGSLVPSEPPVYEMVECRGYFRKWNKAMLFMATDNDDDASLMTGGQSANQDELCYFCTVQLGSIQVIRELSHVEEGKREFTSRHSMEWKFLFLDHRGPPIIGYQPFEVLGTSGYDYYHPEDLEKVAECHEQLMQSGEGTSCFYRFLTKGQQWIWIQTHYYITYHQWSSKPEFIVCTNTVVK